MSFDEISLTLPRHAFSARDTARAGDVWRVLQDAAVEGSTRRGWPPRRYSEEGCAFVVRGETVVHHRELHFGEPVEAITWVEDFKREVFSTRQIRLRAQGELVVSATQEWVHVLTDGGGMRISRACDALLEAFDVCSMEPLIVLPPVETKRSGPAQSLSFRAWFTWMDPLDHANHPAYLDWCDEALCRILHNAGLDPLDLVPVAERIQFKAGVVGADEVTVSVQLVGLTAEGHVVVDAKIRRPSGLCARARLIRTLVQGPAALRTALEGE